MIKLVLTNTQYGAKVNFDKAIFIALNSDYPIIAFEDALQNDFGHTYNNKDDIRLWFGYDSILPHIYHPFDNKWIEIPPYIARTMRISDIGTDDVLGGNIITVLLDVDLNPNRYRCDQWGNIVDTSGEYIKMKYDENLSNKTFKLIQHLLDDLNYKDINAGIGGVDWCRQTGLLSFGIDSTYFG